MIPASGRVPPPNGLGPSRSRGPRTTHPHTPPPKGGGGNHTLWGGGGACRAGSYILCMISTIYTGRSIAIHTFVYVYDAMGHMARWLGRVELIMLLYSASPKDRIFLIRKTRMRKIFRHPPRGESSTKSEQIEYCRSLFPWIIPSLPPG